MKKVTLLSGVLLVLVMGGIGLSYFKTRQPTPDAQPSSTIHSTSSVPSISPTASPNTSTRQLKSEEIANVHRDYVFSATVPTDWRGEAVTAIDAINLYDPGATGGNNLERSQVFIRKFSANQFLTLSTVTIHSRKELTLAGRPAVQYDIEKKSGVTDFPNQPSWRNQRHIVTDIRISDTNPSVFYVIAKRPDLNEAAYQQFLDSFSLSAETVTIQPTPPVDNFKDRITKKKFGQYITKANSPVQPERFSGYHTGVDVEFTDVSTDVPVKSVADGTVVYSGTASGYGGVLAIQHKIDDKDILAIYGHLDPKSIKPKGSTVKKGEQIATLGDNQSTETDGERKHLHLAFVKGSTVSLKGYVQTQSELDDWIDPLTYYTF